MIRRKAIKLLATSAGTLLALPVWAKGWNLANLPSGPVFLNAAQEDLLQELVGVLIPEGVGAPGAVSLGVPAFLARMVADCYEPKVQDNFAAGLTAIEQAAQQKHHQAFKRLTALQKQEMLTSFADTSDAALKDFYNLLKSLTIQGYTSSEYVLVNHLEYDMTPGHYYGCIPVQTH